MTATDLIGWGSSLILLATLVSQIARQWRARRTEAVTSWLFLGQIVASAGFIVYSLLVDNPVFVVTNAAIMVTAIVGYVLLRIRRSTRPEPSPAP